MIHRYTPEVRRTKKTFYPTAAPPVTTGPLTNVVRSGSSTTFIEQNYYNASRHLLVDFCCCCFTFNEGVVVVQ